MSTESSDKSIIQRALEGDQSAFTEILHRYRGSIYNLIFKMVRNKEETEDLFNWIKEN